MKLKLLKPKIMITKMNSNSLEKLPEMVITICLKTMRSTAVVLFFPVISYKRN